VGAWIERKKRSTGRLTEIRKLDRSRDRIFLFRGLSGFFYWLEGENGRIEESKTL
jgi:hypothetical protein